MPELNDFDRIIIGIDPGTNVMGYGILGIKGKNPSVIALGVIKLSRFDDHYMRLHRIFERVLGLVEQYLPDEMAIEAPFFGKNVQSMLKLGRAQGVAMAAALVAEDHPGTTVVTDSITSRQLTEFLEEELGLKHLRLSLIHI